MKVYQRGEFVDQICKIMLCKDKKHSKFEGINMINGCYRIYLTNKRFS